MLSQRIIKAHEFFDNKYPLEKRKIGFFKKHNELTELIQSFNILIRSCSDGLFKEELFLRREKTIIYYRKELFRLGLPKNLWPQLDELEKLGIKK